MAGYLVTGGCGFIGSHLVDTLLAQGHRVRVLDDLSTGRRDNIPHHVELQVGDVADGALVRQCMQGMDGCFHLAAIASVQRSTEEWVSTHRTNLTGTIAVLDAARPRDGQPARPVVFASSAAVYGTGSELPLAEADRTSPISAYGADKLGCELHGAVAAGAFGVPVTALRFFNVYGPRQDPKSPYSGVVSIFSERLANNLPLTIHGDGEQSRDFIYVGDVVRFLCASMERPSPSFRAFNVCTGRPTTIIELASTLAEICDRSLQLTFAPSRLGDIRKSLGNPNAAAAALDIRAKMPLRDGMAATIASLRMTISEFITGTL